MPNMANVLDNPPCHPVTEPIQHRENLEVEAVTLGDAMHMTMLSHETSLREEPRLLSEVNQPLEKHIRHTKTVPKLLAVERGLVFGGLVKCPIEPRAMVFNVAPPT